MKNDLHKAFGQIFNDDISALRTQLVEIQHHHADRKDAEEWMKQLRFLDISAVPDLDSEYSLRLREQRLCKEARPDCVIPVKDKESDNGKAHYVAVSWRWTTEQKSSSYGSELRPLFNYLIRRAHKDPHKSEFPDHYLERAIMFAQSKKIKRLWIDKECIYQKKEDVHDYPRDQERGVQIMDAVYGVGTKSVGLLSTPMVSHDEVHTLSGLLCKSIFEDPDEKDRPKLTRGVDIKKIQMVLLRILSDSRWSRGWM